jgi:hypothetical protein
MFVLTVVIVAVLLNLTVPHLGNKVVDILPGADSNLFLSKFKKMFQFHVRAPLVSSIVVALLVFLSVLLASFVPM